MSTSNQPSMRDASAVTFKSGPAQRRDAFYQPKPQTYFAYDPEKQWVPSPLTHDHFTASKPPYTIRLISWNIDMLVPFGNERMAVALQHLETLVHSASTDTAVVIFLQEMTSSDLNLITSSPWIQSRFNVTDKDASSWKISYYGTTILLDARLSIVKVFRVPFPSKFSRDGLFVDIAVSKPPPSAEHTPKFLRLCNVHLESLIADPPVRPDQLSIAAEYLHAPDVACALLAGDLNAIEPFDRTLHTENNLQDAFLSLGGKEDSDEGYTWGYQVPAEMRKKFGCSRMDKILFCGDVNVKSFDRIGIDVKVPDKVKQAGEQMWVTDHYGVMGEFEINGDWVLSDDKAVLVSKLS
ncbi:hypothetical protein OPT61_g6945 [Boeremia exigua]|uniref:Uncharacterized protein n=1 Tax=Boeremia exigua TaxID=749465 RepID=A0ACC2I5T1_9PLEO|nr:hypothetical protein OPT61_g6945 [Boeremia exigua]